MAIELSERTRVICRHHTGPLVDGILFGNLPDGSAISEEMNDEQARRLCSIPSEFAVFLGPLTKEHHAALARAHAVVNDLHPADPKEARINELEKALEDLTFENRQLVAQLEAKLEAKPSTLKK